MAYYPIAIDLRDRPVLVVGGGSVALRKVESLLEYGAQVKVVTPESVTELTHLADAGQIKLELRDYHENDVNGMALVIAATDDRETNSKVSSDAKSANILVNVVDDPELCTFIVPATVKRGDLTISIGTSGKSPALAKRIREEIEAIYGPEYADFVDILGEARELAKEQVENQPMREMCFRKMMDSDILDLLKDGKRDEARSVAIDLIKLMRHRD